MVILYVENVVVVDIYLLKNKKCPPAMGGRVDCSQSPAYGRAKPLQPRLKYNNNNNNSNNRLHLIEPQQGLCCCLFLFGSKVAFYY